MKVDAGTRHRRLRCRATRWLPIPIQLCRHHAEGAQCHNALVAWVHQQPVEDEELSSQVFVETPGPLLTRTGNADARISPTSVANRR